MKLGRLWLFIIVLPIAFAMRPAFAANSGITYHGRILRPDGSPSQGTSTAFKIQIRSPGSENCLLFEETQTKNMAGSAGVFSLTINDGTGTRSDTSGYSLDKLLANRGTFTLPAVNCASGASYSPNTADGRTIVVSFRDENMAQWESLPPQAINFIPMAIESKQVGGFGPTNLLRVDDAAAAANTTPLNTQQLTDLTALIAGTSTKYMKMATAGTAVLPVLASSPGTPTEGMIWFEGGAVKYANSLGQVLTMGAGGGSGTVTGITIGAGLVDGTGTPGTTITASGTIALANVGTAGTYFKVTTDAQGRVTAGVASLAEGDIPTLTTAGKVSGDAITSGTIGGTTAINTSGAITTTGALTGASLSATTVSGNTFQVYKAGNAFKVGVTAPATLAADYALVLPTALPASSGQVLASDTSGNLSWVPAGTGAVSSVGVTAPIQNTGTASDPVIALAQANGTTNGYLSSGDWTTFNSKLGTSLASGNLWVGNGGGTATAVAPSGDVTMTNAGAFTVAKIQGTAVSATAPSAAGQVLRYDGTSSYVAAALAIGDVTGLSAALTAKIDSSQMPANCSSNQTLTFISPTGSWACSSITVTGAAFGSQTQNLVFAAPDGASGNPTFRALASTDIPNLDASKITTGTLAATNGGTGTGTYATGDLLYASAANTLSKLTAGTDGHVLTLSGGVPSWQAAAGGSSTLSGLTAATATNTIDNLSFAQTWNWSTASTETSLSMNANALTTGSMLNLATSNNSLNSTSGLLSVANTGTSTNGMVASFKANSTAGSGMYLLANGNVGIGTTNPGSGYGTNRIFELAGNSTGAGIVIKPATLSDLPFLDFKTSSGTLMANLWMNSVNGYLGINSAGTNTLMQTAGGSVAIGSGVTFPSDKLHVSAADSSTRVRVVNTSSSVARYPGLSVFDYTNNGLGNPEINFTTNRGNSSSPFPVLSGDVLGKFNVWGGKDLIFGVNVGASMVFTATENFSGAGAGTKVEFHTAANGSTTPQSRLTINHNGNVGVGTTTPARLLDVAGPIRLAPAALPGTPAAGDIAIDSAASNALKYYDGTQWVSAGAGGGSGTVNAGTQNQLAYYGANGSAVSGLATANNGVLVTDGTGVPSIGTTLPNSVQTNITVLGTVTTGVWNGSTVGAQYGGTGVNASAAANGQLLIGNGTGFTLAGLSGTVNQISVATGLGSITLSAPQDIHSGASPTFTGLTLSGMSSAGIVKSSAGGVLSGGNTVALGSEVSGTLAATNGGTGTGTYATGDLLYASAANTLSKLTAGTDGHVLTLSGGVPSWQAAAGGSSTLSALTAATATNTFDNLNFAQTWNWSTASTQTPLTLNANALTTGSMLSLATSNNSLNSTGGLLSVANTGTSTNGVLARFQANSTAGSGLTLRANGNVGVGTAAPSENLVVGPDLGANYTGNRIVVSDTTGATGIVIGESENNRAWMLWDTGGDYLYFGTKTAGVSYNQGLTIASDKVGIGAATPDEKLHIDGGAAQSTKIKISVDTAQGNSYLESWKDGSDSNYKTSFGSFTIPRIMTYMNTSGNVGIGTTTPGQKLSVAGTIESTSGGVKFPDGTVQTTAITGSTTGGTTWVMIGSVDVSTPTTSYTFNGLNGDTDEEYRLVSRVVSNSAATVGYGIQFNGDTANNYVFQSVWGNNASAAGAYSSGPINVISIGNTANTGQVSLSECLIFAKSGQQRTTLTTRIDNVTSSGMTYIATSGGLWNNSASPISSLTVVAGTANAIGSGTRLELWTKRISAGSNQWTNNASDIYFSTGNVGIGTTSPGALLHVAGPMRLTPAVLPGTPAAGDIAVDSGAANALKFYDGTQWVSAGGGGSTGNYSFSTNTLTTSAGNSMTVVPGAAANATSAGNSVLLQGGPGGTTSGDGGDVTLAGGTPTSGAGGDVNLTAAAGAGTNQNGGNITLTAGAKTGTGTNGVIALMGGNVGIGTTTPGQKLSVAGVVESTTGGFRFPDGTVQTTATGGGTGGTMVSNWPDIIRCASSTRGEAILHLSNAPWTDGKYYYSEDVNSTASAYVISYNSDGTFFTSFGMGALSTCTVDIATLYSQGRAYHIVGGGSNLWTASGANTFFGGGNVGIGTTTPQSELQVNGYVQLATSAGQPAATDCDSASEYGRTKVNTTSGSVKIYLCSADGWSELNAVSTQSPYSILVRKSAVQSIPLNTGTSLTFQTPVYNNGFTFNSGDNSITIPAGGSGLYVIAAGFEWASANSGVNTISLGVNGTSVAREQYNTSTYHMNVSTVLNLAAGDVVGVFVWTNNTKDVTASETTFLSLAKISLSSGNGVSDDLGSHSATQNLRLNSFWLSGDGGNEGVRVDSAGNVGIGVTAPARVLHTSGPIRVAGSALPGTPAAGDIAIDSGDSFKLKWYDGSAWQTAGGGGGAATSVTASNGTVAAPSIGFSGDADTGLYSNGVDTIGVSAGGTNIFNISSGGLVSATAGGAAVTTANGTAATPTFSFSGDTDTGWFSPGANLLAASTAGTERVRIDASGNVGIGTTSPANTLEVNGGVTVHGTGVSGTGLSITPPASYLSDFSYLNLNTNWGAVNFSHWGGPLNISGAGFNALTLAGDLRVDSTKLIGFSSSTAYTAAPDSGLSRLSANKIAAGNGTPGNYSGTLIAGNVGIGTTNPSANLDIVGADATSPSIKITNNSSSASRYPSLYLFNYDGTGQGGAPVLILGQSRGSAGSGSALLADDSLGAIDWRGGYDASSTRINATIITKASEIHSGTNGGVAMIFRTVTNGTTSSNERMRIAGDGNVGIGTTSPTAKLEVTGNVRTPTVSIAAGTTTIDMSTSNFFSVSFTGNTCATLTLNNLLDGQSYTIATVGVTSGTCSFSAAGLTFKYAPANAAVSSDTVYTLIKIGSVVYVTWVTGFL